MHHAPYLLQAFAARLLAAKQEETVARAELVKQGYDVETLIEMIHAYNELPENQRGFVVESTATEILIRRKATAFFPSLDQPPKAAPSVAAKVPSPVVKPPALARAIKTGQPVTVPAYKVPGNRPQSPS